MYLRLVPCLVIFFQSVFIPSFPAIHTQTTSVIDPISIYGNHFGTGSPVHGYWFPVMKDSTIFRNARAAAIIQLKSSSTQPKDDTSLITSDSPQPSLHQNNPLSSITPPSNCPVLRLKPCTRPINQNPSPSSIVPMEVDQHTTTMYVDVLQKPIDVANCPPLHEDYISPQSLPINLPSPTYRLTGGLIASHFMPAIGAALSEESSILFLAISITAILRLGPLWSLTSQHRS